MWYKQKCLWMTRSNLLKSRKKHPNATMKYSSNLITNTEMKWNKFQDNVVCSFRQNLSKSNLCQPSLQGQFHWVIVCRGRFSSEQAVVSTLSLIPIVQVALHLRLVPIVPLSRHFPLGIDVIYPVCFWWRCCLSTSLVPIVQWILHLCLIPIVPLSRHFPQVWSIAVMQISVRRFAPSSYQHCPGDY